MDNRSSFNPYVALGVRHDATDQEIQQAMQHRLADDPDSSVRIEHAYRILKNPQLRKQLDEKLERMIWDIPEDPAPVAASQPKKSRRSFFGFTLPKLTLLGVLLTGLAFTTYFYGLREQGIICPDCHHASVYSSDSSQELEVLKCTRDLCAFTFVHDPSLNEDDERET